MPPNWVVLVATVDGEGFVVPYKETLHRLYFRFDACTPREFVEKLTTQRDPHSDLNYYFCAAGVMPVELRESYEAVQPRLTAQRYPPIPAWLGEYLPLWTVFVPNGEYVTYGELGLHYEPAENSWQDSAWPRGETWYRYSADGELLATMPGSSSYRGEEWKQLYCPDYDHKVDQLRGERRNLQLYYGPGYTVYAGAEAVKSNTPALESESPADEILGTLDYDGALLEYDQPLPARASNHGQPEPREYLERVYATQVALGITDPTAPSPFWGQDNGPVMVDSAPRALPLMAQSRRGGQGYIAVQPLDQPDNPYRGLYEPWDYWMRDNANKHDPVKEAAYHRFAQENSEKIRELMQQGKPIPSTLIHPPPATAEQANPWRDYFVYVDAAGNALPMRTYWQEKEEHETGNVLEPLDERDLYPHMFSAGGIMEPAMLKQYEAAHRQARQPYYPPIPAWLAGQPVLYAAFIPNGDVVTLGPLGSFAGKEELDRRQWDDLWALFERGFYRYSPAGELLDAYLTEHYDWERLYFDGREAVRVDAEARGKQVLDRAGFLVIRDTETGTPEAVYDYDGTPLPPGEPPVRLQHYCELLRWETIRGLCDPEALASP